MKPRHSTKLRDENKVADGNILIAKPFWSDGIFHRSVILILEHSELGTTGISLNKKSNLSIIEALPSIKLFKPLYFGGQSDIKIISYLHNNGSVPETIQLADKLYWGGSFEVIKDMISRNKFSRDEINFFAGFVRWESGELESEINENKWWVAEPDSEEIFNTPTENLWSESLENCGHLYSIFGDIPDPSLN